MATPIPSSCQPVVLDRLNRKSSRPLYRQIAETIEHMIKTGMLQSGGRLPSEDAMIKQLSVSRVTLRQAIGVLVDQELLIRRQGKGTYVGRDIQHDLGRHAFYDSFLAQTDETDTELLQFGTRPVPEAIAKIFGLPAHFERTFYERLYVNEGKPAALGQVWLNADLVHLDEQRAATMSGELMLSSVGIRLHSSETSLRAVPSCGKIGEIMLVENGSPLLTLYRQSRDADNCVREVLSVHFRADAYEFKLAQVIGNRGADANIVPINTSS